jgi:DNA-binding winged helix-turn-helix (wHTH) protein
MKNIKALNPKTKRTIPASTTTSHAINRVYSFGPFSINQTEQLLLRHGEPVRLAPKAFDVLMVLIQNRGCLVTKEQLLQEVWPDAFVEEANLSVNIASLRKTLDEGDGKCHCIETIPKRGYRFVAPVSEKTEILNSVAVLPFNNEGCGLAGEYLSTGLMESITNQLSRLRDLRVMARHTVHFCQQPNMDPREVGEKLGVRLILAGRILRLGDQLIVRTELIDVMKGWQLWGEQYRTQIADVLLVQQELSVEIAEKLKMHLSGDCDSVFTQIYADLPAAIWRPEGP